ncbi:MAG: hypothetical protein K2V38_06875 [Gemmataceae bacterium]|nr:hypothetical protein [Gemmataceae bacterium]
MSVLVRTIPDDPADVPAWLEAHLLGPDLDQLAAELEVVHNPPDTSPLLADVLGSAAPAVLARGLAALPRPALKLLLRNPSLLPELRELVLIEGEAYWDRYLKSEASAATRVVARVQRAIAPAAPRVRWAGYVATVFATAAAVLVAVYFAGGLRRPDGLPPPPETASSGWGFQKVEQLPRPATDAQTLTALADLADEFGKKQPATAPELLRRLIEFREGCGALQLAADLPLSEPQARWLKLRCGDWAAEVDGHIRGLEAGGDLTAVRAAATRTATQAAAELRDRASRAG